MPKHGRTYNSSTPSVRGAQGGRSARSSRSGAHASARTGAYSRGRGMGSGMGAGPGSGKGNGKGNGMGAGPGNGKGVSRRAFVLGAAGVGAGAVAVGGFMMGKKPKKTDDSVHELAVPKNAVTSSTDLAEKPMDGCLALHSEVKLPFGTLLYSSDDSMAVCLLPGETASPLTKVGVLWYASDHVDTVLNQAVCKGEGFDIYDVRGNSEGLVWIEADILDGTWRVFSAVLNGMGTLDPPAMLAEGNSALWEMPALAAVGPFAFWQMRPVATGEARTEKSTLHRAKFGSTEDKEMWASTGRFATAPYPMDDKIAITPRADVDGIYYQLTLLDAATGNLEDAMTLPASMKPVEIGYGPTGFAFCFDGIYDYGEGISNLGTYTPMANRGKNAGVDPAAYDSAPWFRFARTPNVSPCWCGNFFMVKSTSAVCGTDFSDSSYFIIDVESGAANYGDYLASTGQRKRIALYSNVTYRPLNGKVEKYCNVRIFTAL